MKVLIFSLLLTFQVTNLFGKGSAPNVPDRCESDTFCVNGKMPLFNQGDSKLISLLQQNVSGSIQWDMGYCVPTAQAMFLAGLKLDAPKAKFNNLIDNLTDLNVQTKAPEIIYNMGQGTNTNWNKGGTVFSKARSYLKKIDGALTNYKRKESDSASTHLTAGTEAGDFKRDIKKHKMMYLISLGVYESMGHKLNSVDCSKNPCEINYSTWGLYLRKLGHGLVINGYEGDYFKIYDPWGRIYNVRIDRKFILFGHRAFFWHMNGAYGFVKSYGMNLAESKKAILLDEFYGIGLQD